MMIWKEPVDLAGLECSKKVGLEFVRNHPNGFYALNVVRSGLAIPDLSLQRKAAEISKLVDPHLLGTVIVLPGEGFWVSAARSFLAGLHMLSPLRTKREVVATLEEGARAIARRANRPDSWARALTASLAAEAD